MGVGLLGSPIQAQKKQTQAPMTQQLEVIETSICGSISGLSWSSASGPFGFLYPAWIVGYVKRSA